MIHTKVSHFDMENNRLAMRMEEIMNETIKGIFLPWFSLDLQPPSM